MSGYFIGKKANKFQPTEEQKRLMKGLENIRTSLTTPHEESITGETVIGEVCSSDCIPERGYHLNCLGVPLKALDEPYRTKLFGYDALKVDRDSWMAQAGEINSLRLILQNQRDALEAKFKEAMELLSSATDGYVASHCQGCEDCILASGNSMATGKPKCEWHQRYEDLKKGE